MVKQFHDAIELKGKHATIMRDGVYLYMPSEIGITDGRDPNTPVPVMRRAEEVIKAKKRFDELKKLPITIRHPDTFMDHAVSDTWINGEATQPEIKSNGIRTNIDCLVDLKNAGVKDYKDGTKELSCGWSGEFVKSDTGPCEYEQLFHDINHIAIVPAGRCGPTCQINDKTINDGGIKKMTIVDKFLSFLKLKKIDVTDEERKVLDSMFSDEDTEEKEKTEDKKKKKSKDEDPDEKEKTEDEDEEEKKEDKKNKDKAVFDTAVKDAYEKGQKELRDKFVKGMNDVAPIMDSFKASEIKDKTPCEIKAMFIKKQSDQDIKDSDPALDAVFNMVMKNYEHPAYKTKTTFNDESKVNPARQISGLSFKK